MAQIGRLLCAIVGLGSLYGAFWHITQLERVADERGMAALTGVGRANLRADVGGVFLAIAIFALLAAWRRSRRWAIVAMTIVGCSFAARLASFAIDGSVPGALPPLGIEVLTIAFLSIAAFAFGKEVPKGL